MDKMGRWATVTKTDNADTIALKNETEHIRILVTFSKQGDKVVLTRSLKLQTDTVAVYRYMDTDKIELELRDLKCIADVCERFKKG